MDAHPWANTLSIGRSTDPLRTSACAGRVIAAPRAPALKPVTRPAEHHSMDSSRTVVVSDADRSPDLPRTLARLARSQARDVALVVVTARSLRLPAALARRVRTVRVGSRDEVAARVAELAAGAGAVVVGTVPADRRGPAISACLIVKDEEAVITACLEAVAPFVDEVVVYDTGSTDRTPDLARAAGATVVQGHWDDHFGDARNRALEHCTGEWVLHVDADEVVTGDPAAWRARLASEEADLLSVVIVSTSWKDGTEGFESRPRRVSRRLRCRWFGRLHEYLDAAPGVRDLTASADNTGLRLLHSGYQVSVMHERGKNERNVDIARAALRAVGDDDPETTILLSNYGRALTSAGHTAEALEVLERVRVRGGNPAAVVQAGRAALMVLTSQGRTEEARAWLPVLGDHGESAGNTTVWRAKIALAGGDPQAAERALGELPDARAARTDVDTWGAPFDRSRVVGLVVAVDLALGRAGAALEHLRGQLRLDPQSVDLGQLVAAMDATATPWEQVLAQAPEVFLDRSLRDVMTVRPALALRWCEAFVAAHPGDHRPVVAGCVAAAGSDLAGALTWSVTARGAGLPQLCPLRVAAGQAHRPPGERAVMWAILVDSFGEFDAHAHFGDAVAAVAPVDLPALHEALELLAPSLAATADETVGAL